MSDDFAVLAAIDASPGHPYEVLDHLRVLGVEGGRTTLHRRVEALIVRGAIEAVTDRGPTGDRMLRLTPEGQNMLAEHVMSLLRYEPLDSPLFALAANCVHVDHSGSLHAILRSRIAAAAMRLTEEERALESQNGGDRYWSRVGRERLIAHLQADITWLSSVMSADRGLDSADDSRLPQAG